MNTELQNLSYDPSTGYVSGQIVVVEWVNGESTVPYYKPKMSFKSTDGTEELEVFVTPTGTNTYYFDRKLEGLTLGKEYNFSVTSGDPYNLSEYKTVPVYTGSSTVGSSGTLGNLLTQSNIKILFLFHMFPAIDF